MSRDQTQSAVFFISGKTITWERVCADQALAEVRYIPLISRVRGPYGKLWTEVFPSFYGPSAKRVGHENKEGRNEDP